MCLHLRSFAALQIADSCLLAANTPGREKEKKVGTNVMEWQDPYCNILGLILILMRKEVLGERFCLTLECFQFTIVFTYFHTLTWLANNVTHCMSDTCLLVTSYLE